MVKVRGVEARWLERGGRSWLAVAAVTLTTSYDAHTHIESERANEA
jgi:hypothetical protein